MQRRLPLVLLIMVSFHSVMALADQVTLKNGDRLSGDILKSDIKTLVIKTEFAGEVTIQWSAVDEIHSSQLLHVEAKERKPATGTITTEDGNLVIATASGGTVTVPKDVVLNLRNPDQETAYEQTLHPKLTQGWAGGANVGFALTAGNSETKNLASHLPPTENL